MQKTKYVILTHKAAEEIIAEVAAMTKTLNDIAVSALKACDGFDAQPNHETPEAKAIMDELRRLAEAATS